LDIVSDLGFRALNLRFKFLGDHGEGETPVPIPNTEVKPFSADGTAWATVRESRTLPRLKIVPAKAGIRGPSEMMGFFFSFKLLTQTYPRYILHTKRALKNYYTLS
jgi:hypothetical protein